MNLRTDNRCTCSEPTIRCDHRGCFCIRCGLDEPKISPGLQKAIEDTCEAISKALRLKEPRP